MMKTRSLTIFVMILLLTALAVNTAAAPADPHSGTWKMNPGKSKYSPGPGPKSLTVKVEADEKQIKLNADGINGDGTEIHVAYTAKFDGKDYPETGIPNVDAVSVKRLKDGSIQSQQKKGGQVVMTITTVVSKDGKTRTATWKGKDAQGRDVNNVVVSEKQ
jgi:hypothetical protein